MNIFDLTRFNARAEENRALKTANEDLRKQVTGLTNAYQGLSGDNDSLFAENAELNNTNDVLRDRNKKLGQENAELKITLRKYTHEAPTDTALGTLERRNA